MRRLPDGAVERLRLAAIEPALEGTRYVLGERLGEGGMGTVWRATDRELGRDVAIKVLHAETEDAPGLAERLRREARVLARLEHPGVVPVYEAGTLPGGRVFYAMRLVRGRRLDEAVAGLPLPARLRILIRVAETVAYAHAHGVVHRDLKPANVMTGAFGEVLVLDWGLSRLLGTPGVSEGHGTPCPYEQEGHGTPCPDKQAAAASPLGPPSASSASASPLGPPSSGSASASPLGPPSSGSVSAPLGAGTAHGTVLGTPGYMAPEQARGDVAATGPAADVYALGALLHFLAAGAHPQAGPDPFAGAPPLPRALAAIRDRASACDPAARYGDVAAFAADLEAFLAGSPVDAYREGPLERLARLAVKHRAPLLLVGGYLVVRIALALLAGR